MSIASQLKRLEKAMGYQKPLLVWRERGGALEEICDCVNIPPGRELLVICWDAGESDLITV